jgi:hypothetical protein
MQSRSFIGLFVAVCGCLASARLLPALDSELVALDAMGATSGACQQCVCSLAFCCHSSCNSRCGLANSNDCTPGNSCTNCVCQTKDGLGVCRPSAEEDTPKAVHADFCFPSVYTVTSSMVDGAHDDAILAVVRRDDGAGFERVDYIDAQAGIGDVVRGFTLRDNSTQSEWRVDLDRDGQVTSCVKSPKSAPALAACVAEGTHFGGEFPLRVLYSVINTIVASKNL